MGHFYRTMKFFKKIETLNIVLKGSMCKGGKTQQLES